jgi:hypothetical protein
MWIEPQVAIAIALKKYKTRKISDISCLVLHHFGLADTARQMIKQFDDGRKYQPGYYTGRKTPYHFFIRKTGIIEQCLPLTFIGPASKKLNKPGIQIALAGDFTKDPPTPNQAIAVANLCIMLEDAFRGRLEVLGHTEQSGTSSDPEKNCPGHHLNLQGLRREIALKCKQVLFIKPEWILKEEGVILYA